MRSKYSFNYVRIVIFSGLCSLAGLAPALSDEYDCNATKYQSWIGKPLSEFNAKLIAHPEYIETDTEIAAINDDPSSFDEGSLIIQVMLEWDNSEPKGMDFALALNKDDPKIAYIFCIN